MISRQFRKLLALVIALTLAAITALPTNAQAITFRDRVIVPFETFMIACNGEEVFLSGELLLMSQTTIDARGGFHSTFTLVPRHVRGTGSAGTLYKAVGGDRSHFNADSDSAPLNFTNTDMFNLISRGGADNLQLKFTFHVTINANGVEAAFVDHFSAECVG
jgi:hypothetical protein